MSQVITGAKAVIRLNGQPILLASSVNVTVENRLEEIPQLDSVLVAEFAENGHRVSFSVNVFKSLTTNASLFGLDPSDPRDLTLLPQMIFQILDDSNNNAEIFSVYGVSFEGGTGAIDARGLWVGQWNFRGIRAQGL